MLNKGQIKLVQTAVRAAGLRSNRSEGRYYLLLQQYKSPRGNPVTSCKQLNNYQLDDLLAICESLGWQHPGKAADHYRQRSARHLNQASYAQLHAIEALAGDLGWNHLQISGMIKRITHDTCEHLADLSPRAAWQMIEALKQMFGRQQGRHYTNCKDVQADMEVAKDGQETQTR